MKDIYLKRINHVFCIVLMMFIAFAFLSCGNKSKGLGKGAEFMVKDVDSFALDQVILMPEYDTDTQTGYGVVFYKKLATIPAKFTMNASGEMSNPVSLVNMTLKDGEDIIKSANIQFVKVDNNPGYNASATFIFRIDKTKAFPSHGTFFYNTNDAAKKQNFDIDLSNIAIPKP